MESNFLKDVVSKKMEAKAGEMMTISKRVYQNRIGSAYNFGRIEALLMVEKSIPEIAEILKLHESTVRSILKKYKK